MANLLQAAKWLEKGKKVARARDRVLHGYMPGYMGISAASPEYNYLHYDDGSQYVPSVGDLLADDWEIV